MSATIRTCPICGAPLPGDAPRGLCPTCLLAPRPPLPDAEATVLLPTSADPTGAPALLPAEPGQSKIENQKPKIEPLPSLGDYELLEEIARGGMGVVYKARQTSLNRTVAVKVILSGRLARPTDVLRFRQEAEAAAYLQHPNIVAIHEVGEQDGHHYFAMDYVEGRDLAALAQGWGQPPTRAAAVMQTLAEAIHYAHGKGVLHRDLKPSNVLIDAAGQPHVTDFGLAKRLPMPSEIRDAIPDFSLTLTGQILGTPQYMPPEQAEGRREALGPASDVYSLGGILFFLLTGRAPFEAETLVETLQQVLTRDPPSASSLNPGVPRDLETICHKCLAKEPERRYPTAQALADDLGRWLRHEPIQARPASVTERARKWIRRHPLTAGLAAAILVSLALGVFAARQSQRADEQRRQTVEANLRRQLQTAEGHFDRDEAHLALAVLARVLRDDPTNRIAAERLVNTLRQRVFLLPFMPDPREALADAAASPAVASHASSSADVLSPNGTLRLLGRETNVITVLDAVTGVTRLVISNAHEQVIRSVDWSPDGQRLVSAAADNSARVWDARTGRRLLLLPHPEAVYHAEFSPDGRAIATASVDGAARVWNAVDGVKIHEMRHSDIVAVNTVRFSPNGHQLITSCDDGTARIWSADTGKQASEPFRQSRPDKAGKQPVLALDDAWFNRGGTAAEVQLETGARVRLRITPGLELRAYSAAAGNVLRPDPVATNLSPDGVLLAMASGRNALVLDAHTRQPLTASLPHDAEVNCIAFSPDSRRLATSTAGKRARLWDARTGHPLSDWIVSPQPIVNVEFSPDNAWLTASAGWAWRLHVAQGRAPAWLADLAEVVAGERLNERQEPETLSPSALVRLLETVAQADDDDPLAAWARGFLTDETPVSQ